MFHLGRDCLCGKEAPQLGGFTSPLCWRCSAMLAGVMAGCLVLDCVQALMASPLLLGLLGGALAFPAGADVFCQLVSTYRSNRVRRLVTGFPLGVGLALLSKALMVSLR
jgi:uncharacterized membrane protein